VLTGVVAHVRNWRTLDHCEPGGPLPTSPTRYRLTIPLEPRAAHFDVQVELNEELRPAEASRIRVQAGLDQPSPFIDAMLLQLDVELRFNRSGEDVFGPVLISLPGTPSSRAFWRTLAANGDDPGHECAARNLAELNFMLGLPGARTADLARL